MRRFRQAHAAAPGISSDTAYDTLYLYAQAIAAAESFEAEKVKVGLLRAHYQGASGMVVFDAKGGVLREPTLVQVRGSAVVPLL